MVLNYAHAYSTFALRSTLDPDLPNNFGSLKPITVSAPSCVSVPVSLAGGCAPHGRHVRTDADVKTLYQVAPEQVLAERRRGVDVQVQGKDEQGEPFTSAMFNYSGGMGARRKKPGLGATCYPTGVAAVPVEVLKPPCRSVHPERANRGSGGTVLPGAGTDRSSPSTYAPGPWLLNAVPVV